MYPHSPPVKPFGTLCKKPVGSDNGLLGKKSHSNLSGAALAVIWSCLGESHGHSDAGGITRIPAEDRTIYFCRAVKPAQCQALVGAGALIFSFFISRDSFPWIQPSTFLTSPPRGDAEQGLSWRPRRFWGAVGRGFPPGSSVCVQSLPPAPKSWRKGLCVAVTEGDEGIYGALSAASEYAGRALSSEGFLDLWERECKCEAGASWGYSWIRQFNLQG